ncbi:hypothetical protein P8935_24040 [Telmatobacter sp. DSM 110680]|uniref:Uncharacterized protein n=1 Tax=Telmatobacter sp. DSM 110680 TaxID=3036704 RepID=A0AAU7DJW3_9BACT
MNITETGKQFVKGNDFRCAVATIATLADDDTFFDTIRVYTALSLCMAPDRSVSTEDDAIAAFIDTHPKEIADAAAPALRAIVGR